MSNIRKQNRQFEDTALAFGAHHSNVAAHETGIVSAQGETQARAPARSTTTRGLLKLGEDFGQFLLRNTRPRITHPNPQTALGGIQGFP